MRTLQKQTGGCLRILRLNTLPFSEITGFSQLGIGDSKNIWDHVSIEAAGRFFTSIKLTNRNSTTGTC